MNNSPDLTQITEMAASLMQPREIALLLDMSIQVFEYEVKQRPEGEIGRAFHKGRLQTKLELRKKIITMAKAGSPQAEVLADKYLQKDI
jgi:hypothetical protein